MGLQGKHSWLSGPSEGISTPYNYLVTIRHASAGKKPILPHRHAMSMQNRRTDDPSEQDRSESFSIKQQKTYDWKQENIRGGKLPSKLQKPSAKKPSQV